jgi:hypothetical protein
VGNDHKIVVLLSLLAFAGCKNTATCKPHTVLLEITLRGDASSADSVEVDVSLGHDKPVKKTFTPKGGSGSIEIDFSSGYPTGQDLEVSVTAFRGTGVVGLGAINMILTGSCAAIPIDVVATEGGDLSAMDLAASEVGTTDDLTGELDLIPAPMCTMSSTCPDDLPVCDNMMCRACASSADDSVCLSRSASTPHCKLSGTNMGRCAQCSANADCPTATPTCNPDGTCRKCVTNSDCDTLLCDLNGTGACIPASDIVYVNSANDPGQASCTDSAPGGKDGSLAHPFCQITTALTLLGVQIRHYIHVAGSANNYNGFEISSTNGTLTIVGPGKDAAQKATVQATVDSNAIHIDPATGISCSVAIVGMTVVGNGNASVLVCGDNSGVANLTVTDCSFSTSSKNAVFLWLCNAKLFNSRMTSSIQSGLFVNPGATYTVQNCAMVGNGIGVTFQSSSGSFSFNTIINNTGTSGVNCGAPAVIADSIVFGNKVSAGTQFQNTNCALSNVVTGTDSYANATQLTPFFVSPSDPHLDLTPGFFLTSNQACCIDKIVGTGPSPSPSPLPTTDIDGSPRPKGAHWDIGAVEAL